MRLLLLAIFGIGLSACSSKSYQPAEPQFFDAMLGTDTYSKLFEEFTQKQSVHSSFEPVITAHITHWSTELRQAFTQEMSYQYRLPTAEAKKLAEDELKEDESYIVFIVSAATKLQNWNQLEKKEGLWRLTLEDTDQKVQANADTIEIVPSSNERWQYFYKKMNAFNKTYRVRFKRNIFRSSENIVFHITGPRGHIEATFKNSQERYKPSFAGPSAEDFEGTE